MVPLQAKAKALLWALQLAKANQFEAVVIVGDSKACIKAIFTLQKIDRS